MSRYAVVNGNVKQKKRRKLVVRFTAFLVFLIALVIVVAMWFYWHSITPTILDIAQTRLISETTMAVNEAVCSALANCVSYNDFVNVERNINNEIVLITANSLLANTLARSTAVLSQNKINALQYLEIEVPFGTLSGIPLLSEKGPTVKVTVSPIGTVNCAFTSYFETAGINQTLHRIYINVDSKIDLIMPTSHLEVQSSTPILIYESVIVGIVPETFLQGGLLLGSA